MLIFFQPIFKGFFYIILGNNARQSRSMKRKISNTIYKTTKGFENVLNGIAIPFANGLGNIIRTSANISETVDKFVSASLKDIDTRLNQPKKTLKKR